MKWCAHFLIYVFELTFLICTSVLYCFSLLLTLKLNHYQSDVWFHAFETNGPHSHLKPNISKINRSRVYFLNSVKNRRILPIWLESRNPSQRLCYALQGSATFCWTPTGLKRNQLSADRTGDKTGLATARGLPDKEDNAARPLLAKALRTPPTGDKIGFCQVNIFQDLCHPAGPECKVFYLLNNLPIGPHFS